VGRYEDAIDTIRRIAALFGKYGLTGPQRSFLGCIDTFSTGPDKARAKILLSYQGGMGSFSDIILQKGGRMRRRDNDELDRLILLRYAILSGRRIPVQTAGE
jgi:hypothetical protein